MHYGKNQPQGVASQHVEFAVCEIDDPHDAEDQRQPNRERYVERAEEEVVLLRHEGDDVYRRALRPLPSGVLDGPVDLAGGGVEAVDRLGQPGEIASAIVFLASPLSAFVTGQVLVVDGGQLV